ncbi:MAG: DUF2058 domain-containing protein [Proteobacteria bacterium]|nr:DUF2058 domain-containing protein [Pseudomonadota bacterium]MDA0896141.1 DUF2058 domain-containing protein [Pseudomonadota bacterium]MDA1245459.1 DUF2058 domain-containing protein [Pseudomonadota bacterium]
MGLSLQDQLKKSGLVDEKKAKQLERAKRKESKQPQQKKTVKKNAQQEAELARKKLRQEQIERDRKLNEERNRDGEWRAKMAQIRQLIEANAMKVGGDLKFNFKHENKVKQIWVDARTREQLSGGTLAVVESKVDGKYVVVPVDVAHKIQERSAEHFVTIANPKQLTKLELEEQAYADFAIPDDLDW